MSKEGRVRGGRGSSDKSGGSVPYSTITRRERSRKLAQKRRDIYKQIMDDMTEVMPFPKDVVAQLDYNSRLRLTICFFRMKAMLKSENEEDSVLDDVLSGECGELGGEKERMAPAPANSMEVVRPVSLFKSGMLQDLMCEALDGFLMVTQLDGTIIFLSESIHKHLGLFQSEHIGINMYDLVLDEDHEDVRQRISEADDRSVKRKTKHGTTDVNFFCRMKCSRFKLANTVSKSPGFKLVYVSGSLKVAGDEPFLATVVRPVSPPAVLELRMEGNMFVAHYSMQNMACIYFDGRLRHLLGYTRDDFIGKTPFDFQHHDDLETTLACSRQVQTKGKGQSGYYRFLNRFGEYIWIQSRAVVVFDSCSGKPSHMVCTSYVISKEDGTKDLLLRQAIASGQSEFVEKTLTPESPFALKKQAEGKNSTHLQNRDGESSALLSRMKRREPMNGHRLEPDSGHVGSSDANSSSAVTKGNKSGSLLYSMLANGKLSPPSKTNATKNDRGSTTSVNSVNMDEATDSGVPSQQTNVSPRLQSFETEEGYLPGSTTISNESSPYNPLSVQQHEDGKTGQSTRLMSSSDRTMSGSDLGYYSESSGSLRERLTSTFTGYESETSSYVCDMGADTSPQTNPYSPDYPLSVLSSDGSMNSHVSFMTASPSESHSQSLFRNPSSVHSSVGSPTYMLPMDEYDFNNRGYSQQSPGNQSVNSDHSDLIPPGSVQKGSEVNLQQQWSPNSIASSPQQFSPPTNGNGENPANYSGQRGLAYAKMDPVTSASFTTLSPRASPGSRYVNGSSPPMLGQHTNTTSSASLLFSDVYITSVTDASPRTAIQTLQTSPNGAVNLSDLPQLTVEDLKMLDSFDQQSKEEDQFGQLLYQQTALSCRGTMMM